MQTNEPCGMSEPLATIGRRDFDMTANHVLEVG